jgi:hypothetical protein
LEADDVGPKPDDLGPHELNPPGQRRPFTNVGLIKVLEIECCITDFGHQNGPSLLGVLPRMSDHPKQIRKSHGVDQRS